MSYFHRKNCHEPVTNHIKAYLETKHGKIPYRVVDSRFYNMDEVDDVVNNWDKTMERTKKIYFGRDNPTNQNIISYYHFVVSPSPEDNLNYLDVMNLGEQFVIDAFGEGGMRGSLRSAQVAMICHNDSENKEHSIPHVHIVINNVDLDTGKRLHFSNKENKWFYTHIQELCEERGYHSFSLVEEEREKEKELFRKQTLLQGAYITKTERSITSKENYSWKQDLRNRILIAKKSSDSIEEFITRCETLEIKAEKRTDDFLFYHEKNPTRWKVSGYKLGGSYTLPAIERDIERSKDRRTGQGVSAYNERILKENLTSALSEVCFFEAPMEVALSKIANVLRVQDKYRCYSEDDFEKTLDTTQKRIERLPNAKQKEILERELKLLREAVEDVKSIHLASNMKSSYKSKKPAVIETCFPTQSWYGENSSTYNGATISSPVNTSPTKQYVPKR